MKARPIVILAILLMSACHPRKPAKDAAEQALDDARRLEERGDYEAALQKYIWFHNHALEVDSSYYGVRLSFALSDWVELGRKYPKALEALRSIRDQKTARLLGGEANRGLFHDVESINDYLGESQATVALFKNIAATNPEFAGCVYDLTEEELVEAGEYTLIRQYLGDPRKRLATAKQQYEAGLKFAREKGSREADTRQAYDSIFTDEVVRLLTILDKTGDRALALELQADALKTFDSPAIRNAVSN